MKNLFQTLIAVMLTTLSTSAQTVSIGPKIGLNLANYSGAVTNDRSLAGIQAGGIVEIQLIDLVSIQPELLFSIQGASFENVKDVYNYVNLPIMGKIYPIEGLYGEVGPQIGFLLSANEKSIDNTNRAQFTQQIKTVDFGLNFGAGYKLPDLGLAFGLRYSAGLSNFPKNNSRIKHGVFQLYTSWAFEL